MYHLFKQLMILLFNNEDLTFMRDYRDWPHG